MDIIDEQDRVRRQEGEVKDQKDVDPVSQRQEAIQRAEADRMAREVKAELWRRYSSAAPDASHEEFEADYEEILRSYRRRVAAGEEDPILPVGEENYDSIEAWLR